MKYINYKDKKLLSQSPNNAIFWRASKYNDDHNCNIIDHETTVDNHLT